MRIWLLNASEPCPYITPGQHPMRTAHLARVFVDRGHEVVWWRSTFDHITKTHVAPSSEERRLEPRFSLNLLHSRGYQKHVSLARMLDHRQIGSAFRERSQHAQPPDLILCSMPIPELAREATRYGALHKVPVVLDLRDWWPDIFLFRVARPLRWVGHLMLSGYFRMVAQACAQAAALTTVTDAFLAWGLAKAARSGHRWDGVFPHGFEPSVSDPEARAAALQLWAERFQVRREPDLLTVVYIGSLGDSLDLTHVLQAARRLQGRVRFVLCGHGHRKEAYERLAAGLTNVVLPGWVDRDALQALMGMADVGLAPLPDRPDFLATINNKTVEYFSAGLPVLSSPNHGSVAELLRTHQCGQTYAWNDSDALVASLESLLQAPDARLAMGARGQALFQERFQAKHVYGAMADHLEALVAAWTPAP